MKTCLVLKANGQDWVGNVFYHKPRDGLQTVVPDTPQSAKGGVCEVLTIAVGAGSENVEFAEEADLE